MIKCLFFSGEIFSSNGHLRVITGMEVPTEKMNLTNYRGNADKLSKLGFTLDNGTIRT